MRRSTAGLVIVAALFVAFATGAVRAQSAADVSDVRLRRAADLHRRGVEAMTLGRWDTAREAFMKALALVPEFPEAHLGLGHLAMRDGKFAEALAEYERAERGYASLGDLLRRVRFEQFAASRERIRRIDDRIRELSRTLARIESGTATPQQVQIQAQIRQRIAQLEDRRRELETITAPGAEATVEVPAEVWFFQGNALYRLGRVEDAMARWQRALDADPRLAPAYNNLAAASLRLGQRARARELLGRARALGLAVNEMLAAAIDRVPRESLPVRQLPADAKDLLAELLPRRLGDEDVMRVPGGIAAVVRAVPSVRTAPDRFAESLNRILLWETPRSLDWRASSQRLVLDGFARIARAGERLGGFPVTFDGRQIADRRRFATLARSAGWAAQATSSGVRLTEVPGGEAEARRRAARLLGWDLAGAAGELGDGRTLTFDLPVDTVPSLLPLDLIAQLVSTDVDADEAFRVLVGDPRTGLIAAGWRRLDDATRRRIDRRALVVFRDRAPWRFARLAPVLAIDETGVRVPGGAAAAGAWTALAGASPADVGAFLEALAADPTGRLARLFRATAPLDAPLAAR
ncbi:MAG: tetratricopeptide repeat protein, partial [Acidobacteria bacterium]